jgi:two-component system response regulator YesN
MYQVLIVDDEQYVRERVTNHMPWREIGFDVFGSADSGERVLEMLETTQPHVLLTDILMPGMTGLELIQLIKERYPQIKVIIMSAYDDFKYAQQAMRLGVKGYLLKPIIREEFVELFETVIKELRTEIPILATEATSTDEDAKSSKQNNVYVAAAIRYIQEHYSERIRLEDVAEFLYVNPNYFSSVFKREMGKSFVDYINETRVRKSLDILLETEEKIYEISMQVGYGNFSYFNKIFKRIIGVTPQTYRELGRNSRSVGGTVPPI